MMDPVHSFRLSELSTPWCSTEYLQALLGIDMKNDQALSLQFRSWSQSFLRLDSVERADPGNGLKIHRHALETFLAQNHLVSWKLAAVHLGMSTDDLQQAVKALKGKGLAPLLDSGVSDQLVREREAAELHRAFDDLRRRVFSDHSEMCRLLHGAIRKELGMTVEPLICVTSAVLDSEPDIASDFDALTLEPVGLRYQVWLETGKPINLHPDVCSLKFYVKHETELRSTVMKGSEPSEVDDRLRAA